MNEDKPKEHHIGSDLVSKPSLLLKILNNTSILASVICYGIIIYLLIFHRDLVTYFFEDYHRLRDFITPGLRVPIFLIALFFSVVLAINPFAQLVPILSMIAFFYGINWAIIFGCISNAISTLLTLSLSRHYGQKAVKKILGANNWEKVKVLADEEGALPFFIAHLFPIFPDAIVVWIGGTTHIPFAKYTAASVLARIPGLYIAALIGSGVVTEDPWFTTATFLTLVAISLLLTKYRKQILNLVDRNK